MSEIDPPPSSSAYNPEYPLDSDDADDELGGRFRRDPFSISAASHIAGPKPEQYETNFPLDSEGEDYTRHPSNVTVREQPPPPKVYRDLFCVKTYRREDLYPTELDPVCYPAWTLSAYWPVYVSNFQLISFDEVERNVQVATYFASKGLLSRMIYVREGEDSAVRRQQRKTLLQDMLVYFTCQEDAERAIRCCDKTTYYGHTLNVLPGRVPVYFDPERTVCFRVGKKSFHLTDTIVEQKLRYRGCDNIGTIVKYTDCEVFVEFDDGYSMRRAVAETKLWIPSMLSHPVKKQRYLEQDCKYQMMFMIQENPSFLDMVPPEYVLNDLLNGKLPPVVRDWENWTAPKRLRPEVMQAITRERLKTKQHLLENAKAKREAKRKGLPIVKNPDSGYIKRHKQEVLRQKEAILGITHHNPKRRKDSFAHAEWIKSRYNKLLEEFNDTRSKLLIENRNRTLAERNKLFYDLLRVEKELGNHIDKYLIGLELNELYNGLAVAIIVAGETPNFPRYPTDLEHSDEQEPLDKLWPVYVTNFPVTDLDPKARNQQITEFFASKGCPVQMVYLDDNDGFYSSYLKIIKQLDMLVYFQSKEVADSAIEKFNRITYRGSKVNLLPGRKPIYYQRNRTVCLKLDKDPIIGEQSIDRVLVNSSPEWLHSLNRHPKRAIFAFMNKTQLRTALYSGVHLEALPKRGTWQRYTEKDVKQDLLRRIVNDADFLNHQPEPNALRQLFVVESMPADDSGEIVWVGEYYQQRKRMNERIGAVLDEWEKLQ